MRRLMYLFAILLISSLIARADETITVSAANSDISANLDLRMVAKLFGEAKDLEEFETLLNNPDSAFVNLDLNGDGDVDYIRVVETTSGNKHLIVLQAVLAKDIYQDVASIFVEKDEANNVSVQVIGDEYIYGENYVIEPVYIYRPVIYDWFWGPSWVCWNSPWYWGYWPYWWHPWACWNYWAYWDHCHHFHHHHHGCSFHYAQSARPATRTMSEGVSRRDYANANPGRSFSERNAGKTNARQLPVTTRPTTTNGGASTRAAATTTSSSNRTFGSAYTTPASRSAKTPNGGASARVAESRSNSASATSTRPAASTTRPAASTTRPAASTTRPVSNSSTTTRPANTSSPSTTRSSSSFSGGHSGGSFSGGGGASTRGGGGGGGASPRR